MEVYAFILARGGSKGVPKKNILDLAGKPLLAWTIEAAQNAPEVTRVFVSTDDKEIAKVGENYGAEVLERPSEMAGDMSLAHPVFEHHLNNLINEGSVPDVVVDLRPTSPLRTSKRISEGIQLLVEAGKKNADSVRAITSAAVHPCKTWEFKGENIVPFVPKEKSGLKEPYDACRQMLPDAYQNNGAMYAIWPETILKKKSLTGEKIKGYVMEPWESINIDTEVDFLVAEALIRKYMDKTT